MCIFTVSNLNKMTQEILNHVGLNWECSKEKLQFTDGIDTSFYGIRRMDNDACLGVVTEKYCLSQNSEIIELLDNFFPDTALQDYSGLCLKGGKRVGVKIKGDTLFKGTNQALTQSILVMDSHDGSIPFTVKMFEKVLVCENGLVRDFEMDKKVKITHTKSMTEKLRDFEILYGEYLEFVKRSKKKYEYYMNSKVTMDLALDAISYVFNCDAHLNEAEFKENYSTRKWNNIQMALYSMETELERQGMNKFGVLQGITHYTNHVLRAEDGVYEGTAFNMNSSILRFLD
jgi:Domain of unknown function (DUF932)